MSKESLELELLKAKVDRLAVRLGTFELILIPLLVAEICRPRIGERLEDRLAHLQAMRLTARRSLQEYTEDTDTEVLDLIGEQIEKLFDHMAFQMDSASFGD